MWKPVPLLPVLSGDLLQGVLLQDLMPAALFLKRFLQGNRYCYSCPVLFLLLLLLLLLAALIGDLYAHMIACLTARYMFLL